MSRIVTLPRAAAIATLALLAGCEGNIDFSVTKTFTANSAGSPATYSSVQQVDLSADASDAWDKRDKVKGITLASIEGTITGVNSGAIGTTGGGSIYLRPDGATDASSDVLIGTWSNQPIIPATTLTVTLSPASMQIIDGALGGNGRFSVVMSGSTAAEVSFNADITLNLKLEYKTIG
jgi:hypothetical protein